MYGATLCDRRLIYFRGSMNISLTAQRNEKRKKGKKQRENVREGGVISLWTIAGLGPNVFCDTTHLNSLCGTVPHGSMRMTSLTQQCTSTDENPLGTNHHYRQFCESFVTCFVLFCFLKRKIPIKPKVQRERVEMGLFSLSSHKTGDRASWVHC